MAIFNEPAQWDHVLGSKADVRPLPDDTSATTGLASLQKLFQMINQIPLDAGGVAPGRLDFNALFKLLGDSIFYAMNGGLASYNQAYDYPVNRFVAYNNNLYKCVKANGPSASIVVPGTNDSVWQAIPTKIEIPSLIPIATLLAKGIVQLCDNIDANASDNTKALTPYAVARQNYVKTVNKVRADAYGNVSITRVNSAASADYATKAAQDATGQQINTTYIKSLAINGRTITYTKGNGATGTITTQDTTYSRLSQFWNDVGYITSAGSCAYATKAALDSAGQQIDTTYVKGVTASNATITVTKGNGTTSTATINNVANATNATNATKAIQDKNGAQIDTTYFKSANGTFTGNEYFRDVNNGQLRFNGGNTNEGGASLKLFGKNAANAQGIFVLGACTKEDASDAKHLVGTPTGALTWDNKHIVRSVNGMNADNNGNVNINFGATVVQSYVNNSGWYRLWSDGWLEQGYIVIPNDSYVTVTFLKAFANTNYTIQATPEDIDGNAIPQISNYINKTVTSVQVCNLVNTDWVNSPVSVYICGIGA